MPKATRVSNAIFHPEQRFSRIENGHGRRRISSAAIPRSQLFTV